MRAAPPPQPREEREGAAAAAARAPAAPRPQSKAAPAEIGGPKGPEPTRYGDWERNGRCSDF